MITTGAFIFQAWLLFRVLRQHGRVLRRVGNIESVLESAGLWISQVAAEPQLAIASQAPSFELPSMSGEKYSLRRLCSLGKPVLLIFTDPNCGPCNALLPATAGWERDYADSFTVALISRGMPAKIVPNADRNTLNNVLLQRDQEVATEYRVPGTPAAILVGADELIRSGTAFGSRSIENLVAQIVFESGSNFRSSNGLEPAALPRREHGSRVPPQAERRRV